MSSYFDWLEAHGGLDPSVDQPEDETSPCGCGKPGCRIDGNDSTNVNINGKWFASDCAGLCYFCGSVDDLRNLDRIAGSWLAHGVCASRDQQLARAQESAARADEARDDVRR